MSQSNYIEAERELAMCVKTGLSELGLAGLIILLQLVTLSPFLLPLTGAGFVAGLRSLYWCEK
jgi:hypothetical protein